MAARRAAGQPPGIGSGRQGPPHMLRQRSTADVHDARPVRRPAIPTLDARFSGKTAGLLKGSGNAVAQLSTSRCAATVCCRTLRGPRHWPAQCAGEPAAQNRIVSTLSNRPAGAASA
ncbi:hypothetical protein BLAT2472_30657 [Burkholderia latens]